MAGNLIRRNEAIDALLKQPTLTRSVARRVLMQVAGVDAVSRAVYLATKWERDCAIEQLKEHGIPVFGIAPDVVKVVRCRNCKHYAGIDTGSCRFHSDDFGEHLIMDADDFCSYGERREENEKG